ncbi:MAG: putative C-S lyase [Gammaproteobacteria bacterium]|nr:putative C-S lyase [Gammaproteobacteria bacterium]
MNINDITIDELRNRAGAKWREYPADVLPAWVADMDFAVAETIRAALAAEVENSTLGYAVQWPSCGLAELFAERLAKRYGWTIAPASVDYFNDVVQGIYLGLMTLSAPGEGAVVQTPVYPPFTQAVQETGRRPVFCPLVPAAGGHEIDFDMLRARIDATTRVLMLCHPQNPTGRAFTRGELEALAAIVLERKLYVISDEIHADLMLDERPHLPFAAVDPEVSARTLTLMSASKAFNIAGLGIGFGVYGSDSLRKKLHAIPHHVRGGRSTLGMAAARAAWTSGDGWLEAVRAQLRANRERIAAHVATHWPAIRHVPPQATYLAWLDCRALKLPTSPMRFFLEHAKVALSDGKAFGPEGEGWVRLNFATTPAILDEILGRMDEALKQAGA